MSHASHSFRSWKRLRFCQQLLTFGLFLFFQSPGSLHHKDVLAKYTGTTNGKVSQAGSNKQPTSRNWTAMPAKNTDTSWGSKRSLDYAVSAFDESCCLLSAAATDSLRILPPWRYLSSNPLGSILTSVIIEEKTRKINAIFIMQTINISPILYAVI